MTPNEDDRPKAELMEEAINAAIHDTSNKFDSSFTIKWVAVAEILNEDGERDIWTFTSPEAKRWDIFGLLEELRHFQSAHTIAEILEDHQRG